MGIRSTSNIQSFIDDFYRSGTDASLAAPDTASASGGVKITDGDNVYHIFLGNSGPDYAATAISEETFTINSGTITDAEILVVGGGGGGKNDGGGGGGAGAVYHATGVPLPSSPIPITIGERGTGNTTNNGGDTTFGPVTAQGGGYGNDGSAGGPGGSGGGGGGPGTPSGGTSTASPVSAFGVTFTAYGNEGAANPVSNDGGSGGGGAGGAGTNRNTNAGGAGGPGRAFPGFPGPILAPALPTSAQNVDPNYGGTSWPSATTNSVALQTAWQTATGPTGLFGGGGGGGAYFPVSTRAEGGSGGGGSGASTGPGTGPGYAFPGLDYTGGGGGAATSSSAQSPGRPGGRGVVIIKYS
tara:strand:+ start:1038 stop:2102 length:1065 start_codon:yes stop_codon:yes gene_type:complete